MALGRRLSQLISRVSAKSSGPRDDAAKALKPVAIRPVFSANETVDSQSDRVVVPKAKNVDSSVINTEVTNSKVRREETHGNQLSHPKKVKKTKEKQGKSRKATPRKTIASTELRVDETKAPPHQSVSENNTAPINNGPVNSSKLQPSRALTRVVFKGVSQGNDRREKPEQKTKGTGPVFDARQTSESTPEAPQINTREQGAQPVSEARGLQKKSERVQADQPRIKALPPEAPKTLTPKPLEHKARPALKVVEPEKDEQELDIIKPSLKPKRLKPLAPQEPMRPVYESNQARITVGSQNRASGGKRQPSKPQINVDIGKLVIVNNSPKKKTTAAVSRRKPRGHAIPLHGIGGR